MSRRLDSYGRNTYSQFGEDGVISHLLDVIGIEHRVCVEFGAADGISCSNTARLWRDQEWKALLVEPAHDRYEELEGNAGPFDTICRRAFVTPTGPTSIAALLAQHDIDGIDVMSVDVDGDDFLIVEALECRPRILAVEFNPTIPPHLDIHPRTLGSTLGSSALALVRLGESMGYRFVGATYCNVFFVDQPIAEPFTGHNAFAGYETDLTVLFPPTGYTYAVTDFYGRVMLAGEPMPWQPTVPYVSTDALDASGTLTPVTQNPQEIRRGFESLWGPAAWIPAAGLNPENLTRALGSRPQLVCVDLTQVPDLEAQEWSWLWGIDSDDGYDRMLAGRVLGLVPRPT